MVCYARSGIGVIVAVIAVLVAFGGGLARYLDMTALALSLVIVFGTAVVVTIAAFIAVRTIQHRRARAGGCVGCTFQCQHAMTSSLSLIRIIDREPPAPVGLPTPKVRIPEPRATVAGRHGPRWPDQPVQATAVMQRDH